MVKAAKLQKRFRAFPNDLLKELRPAMERGAREIVAQMNALKPLSNIEVDWTWGDGPAGSFTLGRVGNAQFRTLRITIFATATTTKYPNGFPAIARWFEFGTALRVQSETGRVTGAIAPQPFFYPVYRANVRRARSRVTRAVTAAVKRNNAR